ncbi:MAG: decaprenyl-phosphate phosphoribosyltransferase [Candidatus Schekmanbacteria bacterium]|nr:decaprenyl-phosphate phosphoribosyltransferase [Candidatus Schekmanbacteria bacterium]
MIRDLGETGYRTALDTGETREHEANGTDTAARAAVAGGGSARRPVRIAAAILESMRPKQWTKNLVVLAPLVFSLKLADSSAGLRAALCLALFCCISGAVYLLNDVIDRERDRLHPQKRHRPVASGRLSVAAALGASFVLLAGSMAAGGAHSAELAVVLVAYYAINVGYSTVLKQIVIVDTLSIALGFVLRAIAGAVAIAVVISPWLLLCTFLLALFLALCKRRSELIALGDAGHSRRPVLREYTPELLDQMVSISSASTLLAYCLYTISDNAVEKFGTTSLFYTVPFVLFGIFRYLYLVHQHNRGDTPEQVLLEDLPLISGIVGWSVAVLAILYFKL